MNELIRTYLDHYNAQHDRPKTRAGEFHGLAKLDAWLEGREVSAETLAGYRTYMQRAHLTDATKRQYVDVARRFVHWLILNKQADAALLQHLSRPKVERVEPQAPRPDALRRMFEQCGKWPTYMGATVLLSYLVPARQMELANMKPGDFILGDDPHVILTSTKTRHRRRLDLKWLGCGVRLLERLAKNRIVFRYDWRHYDEFMQAAGFAMPFPFKTSRIAWSSYAKASNAIQHGLVDRILSHTAEVAAKHYDDTLLGGITGQTVPEWYGCADVIAAACETCILPTK